MDEQKYPKWMLAAIAIYVFLFLLTLSYIIIPGASLVGDSVAFYVLTSITFVPLIGIVAYELRHTTHTAIKLLVTAASVMVSVFLAVFVLPIVVL